MSFRVLGLDTVTLAGSYHAGKFLRPHGQSGKVYFPEDGTVYFKANAGREVITDFTDGEDLLILFPDDQIQSVADLLANHTHQRGGDLVISGDGTEMILRNFDKANLTEADFTV